MGERGATGGAWGARDDASWWPGGSGELQHQQQINEEIARSTAAATHQLYTYKMTGGFNNSGDNPTPSFDYRLMTGSNARQESPQQPWWYASGSVEAQQTSSSELQQQAQQQQALTQTKARMPRARAYNKPRGRMTAYAFFVQTCREEHKKKHPEENVIFAAFSKKCAERWNAQAALQQQVVQSFQQQQQNLHDHLQAVQQQQQIQAALQRQSATLQELQQQAQQQQALTQTKARMPRARAYNKPRGRMTAYAFFVQTCREEHKKKHPEENVIFAAFSKKCAERWNTMSKKEKQRFHDMADQDKQRYDLEMQSYVPPKDVKVRGRKRHQPKDPNAPKRSLSAFFWFCNEERSKVKAKYPDYTMGDIAKELGRRWAAADPDTKGKYDALSEQDKARYDREMTAYKKTLEQAQAQPEVHEEVEEYEAEEEYKC
ncbi:High mobility group protein DSP1 [Papilio xuthus]|uniref:High mobility group protein DSP1 n=1 Tax=Papilio xuthus TaxID=66420 RepID=A0A194Q6H2_PAPXU|nr:High mobility group protein DSP1 [Papilio xuthus]